MQTKILIKAYYLIIPFLIFGISFGYTTFLLALLALIPLSFVSNRHTLAIYLMMYGGPLGGVIRSIYPFLPIYGILMVLLGLFLMRDLVLDLIKYHYNVFFSILIVFLVFGVFFLIGPQDSFSRNKYLAIITHGLFMVIGYYAFDRSKNIDAHILSLLLLITSISMLAYIIRIVNIEPQGFFNYNWFRTQLMSDWALAGEKTTIINYQQIGMTSLFALAIYISQIQLRRGPFLFFLFCALQLVLVSGCRQAILGVAIIVATRFAVFRLSNVNSKKIFKKLLLMVIGLLSVYLLFIFFAQYIQSDFITQTIEEGDDIRERIYDTALLIFFQHPIAGAGLGGYHYITGELYPHNFILELLCETGLLGLSVALLLLIIPFFRNKQGLLHISASNQFLFLILLGTLVRVMVSSDLTESIELFSAVFAITAGSRYYRF